MARIRYKGKNFGQASLAIIKHAVSICEEYQRQGYDLTLRQLFYQFVSRDLLPNTQASYSRLGDIINDARMAGLLDWDFIVDRTRNLRTLSHWDDPKDIIASAASSFRNDKWGDQPNRVEVWIEKDALVGVLEAACEPMDVAYFSCRGYTSASEIWSAAQRLRGYIETGQRAVILHLGDHDPSGIDMTRDIIERLWLFIATDLHQGRGDAEPLNRDAAIELTDNALEIRRIALNMDQVRQYDPPPNPAKFTDARYKKYVETHGRSCWELDALPPDVLVRLIQNEIRGQRDEGLWEAATEAEKIQKKLLRECSLRWEEVSEFLSREEIA